MTIATEEERRRIEARRKYEAGPDFAMWRRYRARQRDMFVGEVDRHKPAFDFVRMVLTTAVVIAIGIYFVGRPAEESFDHPVERGFIYLGYIGLGIIGLYMAWATYQTAIRFGMMLSADVADSFNSPFHETPLRALAKFIVAAIVVATWVIGAVFGNQAIKRTDPPASHVSGNASATDKP